jgi:hypothetical protein
LDAADTWETLRDEPGTTGDQFLAGLKRRGVTLNDELGREVAEFALDVCDTLDETPLSDFERRRVLYSLTQVLNGVAMGGIPDTDCLITLHLRRALRLLASPNPPDKSAWPKWLLRAAE